MTACWLSHSIIKPQCETPHLPGRLWLLRNLTNFGLPPQQRGLSGAVPQTNLRLKKRTIWSTSVVGVLHEPVHIHKGSGSHVEFCPRLCSEHLSMDQVYYPPTQGTTEHCEFRALMPTLALSPPHVSSPRDWAVSTSLHMQRCIMISLAPPQPSAEFPSFGRRAFRFCHSLSPTTKTFSRTFPK